jgi:capsular polysaccharide biosynthesis protein
MALGVPVGLVLGLMLALALELAFRRVRCEDDLTHDLGLPVLGTIGAVGAKA